jgi:hypothetical protein
LTVLILLTLIAAPGCRLGGEEPVLSPPKTFFGQRPIHVIRDPAGGTRDLHIVDGPWGRLQYYPVHLAVPARYLQTLEPRLGDIEWVFPQRSPQQVVGFLRKTGARDLGTAIKYRFDGKDVTLFPSTAFVEALTREQRGLIAHELAQDPRNGAYHNPAVIDVEDPRAWFREAGLSESDARSMAELCYLRDGVLVFSDLPVMLAKQSDQEGRMRVTRAFTRTRGVIARLHAPHETNLDSVVEYWSAGHKRKNLATLLESVLNAREAHFIDIVHLLPPIPRMLAYTYPEIEESMHHERRDCHWTCLNFFRSVPGPVYRSTRIRTDALFSRLDRVNVEPTFGDVLVLTDEGSGAVLHSMVYIAADLVFTKNGNSIYNPWLLMRYQNVVSRYSLDGNVLTSIWRPS